METFFMFAKLSEELKTRRESLGIPLEQTAREIRIDIKFLRAMENGDFTYLPDLYVKAYLKEFAKVLLLDENIILQKYNLAKEGKDYSGEEIIQNPAAAAKSVPRFTGTREQPVRGGRLISKSINNNLIIFGIISFVALSAIIYFLFFNSSTDEIIREMSYEEILEENKNRMEETVMDSDPTVSDSLSLSFKTTDSCWIKVVLDEAVAKEYSLWPKQSLVIKAKESFNLVIGNYRSVVITLNEKPLELEVQKGPVARITVDRNGVRPLVFEE